MARVIKRHTKKPWWSENLSIFWNELCNKERTMLRAEKNCKQKKRYEFLTQRKLFNREVQKAKRKFWKMKQIEIENKESSDQKRSGKKLEK